MKDLEKELDKLCDKPLNEEGTMYIDVNSVKQFIKDNFIAKSEVEERLVGVLLKIVKERENLYKIINEEQKTGNILNKTKKTLLDKKLYA